MVTSRVGRFDCSQLAGRATSQRSTSSSVAKNWSSLPPTRIQEEASSMMTVAVRV